MPEHVLCSVYMYIKCSFLFSCFRHVLGPLLPALSSAFGNHSLHDAHLHSLITALATWQDEFANADFCDVVFDNFLLTMLNQENVLRHTLRLLHFVNPKMDSNKVVAILTATQPSPEVPYASTIYILFH